jgi:acyl dehydratase
MDDDAIEEQQRIGPSDRIRIGTRFRSQRRTISETDLSLMNTLVWATAPIHSDLEYARSTPFGDRIMDGPSALAIAVGLAVIAEGRFVHEPSRTRPVALVGLGDVQFKAPVVALDTLQVGSEVVDVRPTRSGERAIVRYVEQAEKTDGTVVLTWERSMLVQESDQQEQPSGQP